MGSWPRSTTVTSRSVASVMPASTPVQPTAVRRSVATPTTSDPRRSSSKLQHQAATAATSSSNSNNNSLLSFTSMFGTLYHITCHNVSIEVAVCVNNRATAATTRCHLPPSNSSNWTLSLYHKLLESAFIGTSSCVTVKIVN